MTETDVPLVLSREKNPKTAERFFIGRGRYSLESRICERLLLISVFRFPR